MRTPSIKTLGGLLALFAVIIVGFYLRSYFSLISPLPFSPYDLLIEKNWGHFFGGEATVDRFSFKYFSYPLAFFLKNALGNFRELFLIYAAGATVLYFLAKEISGSKVAGAVAVALFAVASENLIQYTGAISSAGIGYVLSWAALFFLTAYFTRRQDIFLLLFTLSGLLVAMSYHTAAVAFAVIVVILLIRMASSSEMIESKRAVALSAVVGFTIFWIAFFDRNEFEIVFSALFDLTILETSLGAAALMLLYAVARAAKKWPWLSSPYVPLATLPVAAILILVPYPFFNALLSIGPSEYYSSAVTLNNYLAQALLLHIYVIAAAPLLVSANPESRTVIQSWLLGLGVIFAGLVLEHYYARIFDFTVPLMVVLAGYYWSRQKRWRWAIITATVVLLIVSQITIYHDPFSRRRYYTDTEYKAAEALRDHPLPGEIVSDLRTAALLDYVGVKNVHWAEDPIHHILFYKPGEIYPGAHKRKEKTIYFVVSESMRHIVYGINFETTPLNDTTFSLYDTLMPVVYHNDVFTVYQIK